VGLTNGAFAKVTVPGIAEMPGEVSDGYITVPITPKKSKLIPATTSSAFDLAF
jgi:hypothetical protein